ncbi:MAG: diaminopimelate epimerase [Victivallaceae bacterium]|nr:diaminopimelate epimerase [Victivallaceae bacterium]
MKFYKYTGLGNDFIFVTDGTLNRERVPFYCDRRFGIGADGVVTLAKAGENEFVMHIFNSDGSEAQMCGNATRCSAHLLRRLGWLKGSSFALQTLAGIIRPTLLADGLVRVDMGHPRYLRSEIPVLGGDGTSLARGFYVTACQRQWEIFCVSMGNPHAVIFVEDAEAVDLEKVGPQIETNALFPEKTNVEFVSVEAPDQLRMRVWERGCGVTMACGTGSCAAGVAACLSGRAGAHCAVRLDGGTLWIDYHVEDNHVDMTGAAAAVYEGEIQ